MRVIIDRFEPDYAVVELEDGTFVHMPTKLLPDAAEGDVVEIKVNRSETQRRKELIQELREKLEQRKDY